MAEARKLFFALAGCKAKEVAKDLQAADCFRQDALQDNEDAQDVLRKLKRTAQDKIRLRKHWRNAKKALQRKIKEGGPRFRSSDDRRPLTPEEIASKQVGQRQLTARELKDQTIVVSDCWSEEQLAQLQRELQEMLEVDAMPVPERTAAITQKLSVQMDREQATTDQNAASLARIGAHRERRRVPDAQDRTDRVRKKPPIKQVSSAPSGSAPSVSVRCLRNPLKNEKTKKKSDVQERHGGGLGITEAEG